MTKKISRRFIYKTELKWNGEKNGLLLSLDKEEIKVSTPPEFRGDKNMWSPEELLIGSVNSCIMTAFLYYVQRESLDLLSYESEAEGILQRIEGKFRFSKIDVKPKIVLSSVSEVEKAKSIIELSERNCFISNSIKAEVSVDADIEAGS
jgi:peroxiredoxin-like protein